MAKNLMVFICIILFLLGIAACDKNSKCTDMKSLVTYGSGQIRYDAIKSNMANGCPVSEEDKAFFRTWKNPLDKPTPKVPAAGF